MISRIKGFLSPPVFVADEEKTRVAGVLNTVLLTVLAGALLASPLIVIGSSRRVVLGRLGGTLALILLDVVLLVMMRRGRVRFAGAAIILGIWAIISLAILFGGGGIRSLGFPGTIILVIIAGSLLGQRAGLATAVLGILSGLFFIYGSAHGFISPAPQPDTELEIWVIQSTYLLMAASMLRLGLRSIDEALTRARRELAERQRAEQGLRDSEDRYRRLAEEAQWQARELELMDRVRTAIAGTLKLSDLFQSVVLAIAQAFGYTHVSLYLLQGKKLILQHQVGYNQVITEIEITQGISGSVARTGRPVLLKDVRTSPDFLAAVEGINSEVCVPIFDGDEVAGVLNVESTREHRLAEADLQMLVALSDHVGIAIAKARLYSEARKNEEQYRQLFEKVPVGIGVVDREGKFLAFNETILIPGGYSREEILALGSVEKLYYDPNARKEILSLLQKRGELRKYPVQFKRRDGLPYETLLTLTPTLFNGQPAIQALVEDISGQRRAEGALKESEEQYRRLVEHSPYAVVVHIDGRVEYLNQAGVRLIGAKEVGDVLGRQVLDFVHTDSRPAVIERLRMMQSGQEIPPLEEKFIRLDGRVIDVEVSAFPFTYQGRRAVQVVFQDISERKVAENRLQRQLAELTVLHAVSVASSQSSSEDEVITRITAITAGLYSEVCGVLLLNEAGTLLTPHPSYLGADVSGWESGYPISEGITGRVVTIGNTVRIGEVEADPQYIPIAGGICSELAVPIRVNERIIGVMNVESRRGNAFDEDDERILNTIAGSLGTAIQKIRLFRAEQKRRREAEHLRESTAQLATSLDFSILYESILDSLHKLVPYDSASVMLNRGGQMEIVAARGLPEGHRFIGRHPRSMEKWTRNGADRKPVIIPDFQADPRIERWDELAYIRGWMGIPLVVQDRVIGFLTVDSRHINAYTEEHADLAQTFANQAAIAIDNARLFESLEKSNEEISQAYDTTLEGWGKALELRDKETQGHTRRVTELTLRLARRLGIDEATLTQIRRGVLVHDIGKMGVPDQILRKAGPLTAREVAEMHQHPYYAYELLSSIAYLRPALDIPFCHHEKWDGTGYPRGLKGEDIPLSARIFSIVDVWDALLSDRPYRKAWARKKVFKYIGEESGKYFDPQITRVFLEMMSEEPEG